MPQNEKKQKSYKGTLTLEWYNKEKSILLMGEKDIKSEKDIPAPKLNWVNKDESLFYEINENEGKGLKPYWVDTNDIRVKEPRPLVFKKAYIAEEKTKKGSLEGTEKEYVAKESDYDDPNIQNILIKGDNLLALNTLVKMFENKPDNEKVKCIYIDPPYNTGAAFENYDDNLEHSEWLTMMRDRLILFKKLMSKDAIIFIQIDYREVGYLQTLLDEIFSKDNFISILTIKVKDVAGVGQESPLFDICEYILIYSNDLELCKVKIIGKSYKYEKINDIVKGYNKIMIDFGKEKLYKVIERQNVGVIKIYELKDYKIEKIDKNVPFNQYLKNINQICIDYNPSGGMINAIKGEIPEKGLSYIEYTPTKGRDAGKLSKVYFLNRRILAWLRHIVVEIDKKYYVRKKLSNLWDVNTASLSIEGGIYFPQSKKPEELIQRIIRLSTEPNDIILDSFAGSGTTPAVAHKMGRRWIGVEIGRHADTHIIQRLKNVISGEDQAGISKSVNWQGGGSFKYYHLGESILSIDKDGHKDFNWNLSVRDIAGGVLYYFDYKEIDDKKLPEGFYIGIKENDDKKIIGLVNIKDFKSKGEFVITELELQKILDYIKKQYNPLKTYLFTNCGVGYTDENIPEGLGIMKVPQEIIASIE